MRSIYPKQGKRRSPKGGNQTRRHWVRTRLFMRINCWTRGRNRRQALQCKCLRTSSHSVAALSAIRIHLPCQCLKPSLSSNLLSQPHNAIQELQIRTSSHWSSHLLWQYSRSQCPTSPCRWLYPATLKVQEYTNRRKAARSEPWGHIPDLIAPSRLMASSFRRLSPRQTPGWICNRLLWLSLSTWGVPFRPWRNDCSL